MKKCNVHRIVAIVSCLCLMLVLAAVLVPVFFFDQFRIGGESMNPTLERGDHILVDKMLMGAMIWKGKSSCTDGTCAAFRAYFI